MIIEKPNLTIIDENIILSCQVNITGKYKSTKKVWFSYPKSYYSYISQRADSFLVGLFFIGMHLQQNIHVKGEISPKLLNGINQVQEYYCAHFPNEFKKIKITADKITPDSEHGTKNACSFSGGVDSFYTLHQLLRNFPKENQVQYSLFISGFDTEVDDPKNTITTHHYKQNLKKINIELLEVKTNIKSYLDSYVGQYRTFGCILISCAMTLGNFLEKIDLASAYQYDDLLPIKGACAVADGSNPISDILLSTEHFNVFHYDASISRIEKTFVIAQWPNTYNNLRVCWKPEGMKNCGICSKCMRTMLALQLCNKLKSYKHNFPDGLTLSKIRYWDVTYTKDYGFVSELLEYCKEKRLYSIYLNLKFAEIHSNYLVPYFLGLVYKQSAQLKEKFPLYKHTLSKIRTTLRI